MPAHTRWVPSPAMRLVLGLLQVLAIVGGCVAVVTVWAVVMLAIISAFT